MALVFTTGTINQPDAGSVGQAMAEKIRDDVSAHAAWELVEEFTPSTGVQRFYVLKCLAAVSGLPADFFVVIARVLATGELRFAICETYNSGSHNMGKYAFWSGSPVYDADGCAPYTFVLAAAGMLQTSNQPHFSTWIPGGTSTKWWIIAADDGFTVAFNGASNAFIHAGAYTPLTVLPIPMPIQLVGYNDQQGALTRNPAVAGISDQAYALLFEGGNSSLAGYGPPLGFQGQLRVNDKLQDNQRPIAEQGMTMYVPDLNSQAIRGWALGKQKRMRVTSQAAPVGFAFGDAYAMAGNLWVPYLPTDGRIWDTGVAAS